MTEIIKLSDLFQHNGYPKTAQAVKSFVSILKADNVPDDFLKRLDSVFNLFHKEFEKKIPVGQQYRKDVFEEIADTTLKAIGRLRADYPNALMSIYPLFKAINKGTKITSQIGAFLNSGVCKDKNVEFHLYCYTYLIIVEGIFDELARILYFLTVASPCNIPTFADLEGMNVRSIKRSLNSPVVFLKDWEDKNHIRNSIAHARATFDPIKDEVQFKDRNWDSGIISLNDFYIRALELEDSIWAFFYDFLLLKIYDFILSTDPFR